MRNYMEEYQRWLDSPALSNAEWEELNAIRDDKKEIESRFFAPLEFLSLIHISEPTRP